MTGPIEPSYFLLLPTYLLTYHIWLITSYFLLITSYFLLQLRPAQKDAVKYDGPVDQESQKAITFMANTPHPPSAESLIKHFTDLVAGRVSERSGGASEKLDNKGVDSTYSGCTSDEQRRCSQHSKVDMDYFIHAAIIDGRFAFDQVDFFEHCSMTAMAVGCVPGSLPSHLPPASCRHYCHSRYLDLCAGGLSWEGQEHQAEGR